MEVMKGKPFDTRIGVGDVIKGWDEGVPQMSLGEKAKLTITPYRPISCKAK
jgi:FK506-binding protein 1